MVKYHLLIPITRFIEVTLQNALWLVKTSHVTFNIQGECFISAWHCHHTLQLHLFMTSSGPGRSSGTYFEGKQLQLDWREAGWQWRNDVWWIGQWFRFVNKLKIYVDGQGSKWKESCVTKWQNKLFNILSIYSNENQPNRQHKYITKKGSKFW